MDEQTWIEFICDQLSSTDKRVINADDLETTVKIYLDSDKEIIEYIQGQLITAHSLNNGFYAATAEGYINTLNNVLRQIIVKKLIEPHEKLRLLMEKRYLKGG